MTTIGRYLLVATGGALGAIARYGIVSSPLARMVAPFPTATFLINVSGSFIIGFILTLAAQRLGTDPYLRLLVAVGFVGSYTTFSTFEWETADLLTNKHFAQAGAYVLLSVVLGLVAVWCGMFTARMLLGQPS